MNFIIEISKTKRCRKTKIYVHMNINEQTLYPNLNDDSFGNSSSQPFNDQSVSFRSTCSNKYWPLNDDSLDSSSNQPFYDESVSQEYSFQQIPTFH